MAAPVDAARVTTNVSVATTTPALNLPGGISAGEILFSIVRFPTEVTSVAWPGWTEISENRSDASDDVTGVACKIADGSEGATETITLGTAGRMAGLCYRITGGDTVEFPASVSGSATHPDSPSYTLAGGEARDVLWLSLFGGEFAKSLTSGPSGYSNATVIASSGSTGAGNATVGGASKQATSSLTENPGVWALDSATVWQAYTFAIYAAAPTARISQVPAEIAILPSDQAARISQVPVEVAVLPTDQVARISQVPVEVAVLPSDQAARVSQMFVEVAVLQENPLARISQMVVEVAITNVYEDISLSIID
jgi:hypothetical protein